MNASTLYLIAADAILLAHVMIVAFIVLGLGFIFIGKLMSWDCVHHFWFRVAHLASIAFVVAQSWLGAICPLTLWEQKLRELAGDTTYNGAFITYWLQTLLYYSAPTWVFAFVYTLFGVLVAVSWFWVRPRR